MYYESRLHQERPVTSSLDAANLIKSGNVNGSDAISWKRKDGTHLIAVADAHFNSFFEVALIKKESDKFIQIESITAGWIEQPEKLAQYFEEANENLGIAEINIGSINNNQQAHFTCGCCGNGFKDLITRQLMFDQDSGFGICKNCEKYYL